MRSFSGLQFDSSLAGLENYDDDLFNFPVDAHNLAAGNVSKWTTTWPLSNTNSISTIHLNYGGLETVWRYTSGAMTLTYGGGTYQVETLTYYSGSSLVVETYIINQTGGVVAIPAFNVNVHVYLYNAPF
jgi:hypothetical protein